MAINTNIYEYGGIGCYIFGVNASLQVGSEAKKLTDGRNCLIITDPGVAKVGLVDGVKSSLEKEGFHVDVCAEVLPEPTIASIKAIVDVARDKKADILIGLGGGSSMDTAKVVGRALTSPGSLEDYIGKAFPTDGIPVITIPTTAGTAAEVTPDCVIRLPEEHVKAAFANARANIAIVDPNLGLQQQLVLMLCRMLLSQHYQSLLRRLPKRLLSSL